MIIHPFSCLTKQSFQTPNIHYSSLQSPGFKAYTLQELLFCDHLFFPESLSEKRNSLKNLLSIINFFKLVELNNSQFPNKRILLYFCNRFRPRTSIFESSRSWIQGIYSDFSQSCLPQMLSV